MDVEKGYTINEKETLVPVNDMYPESWTHIYMN